MSLQDDIAELLERRAAALPDGVELKQSMDELRALYEMLWFEPRARVFVELGVYHGASMFMLSGLVHPEGTVVGVDVFDLMPRLGASLKLAGECARLVTQDVTLIRGETVGALPRVGERLDGRKIDWLHIDAGHSYGCVARDFATYRPLLADGARVQFHDIRHAPGVSRLWSELRATSGAGRCVELGNTGLLTYRGRKRRNVAEGMDD